MYSKQQQPRMGVWRRCSHGRSRHSEPEPPDGRKRQLCPEPERLATGCSSRPFVRDAHTPLLALCSIQQLVTTTLQPNLISIFPPTLILSASLPSSLPLHPHTPRIYRPNIAKCTIRYYGKMVWGDAPRDVPRGWAAVVKGYRCTFHTSCCLLPLLLPHENLPS